VAKAQPPEAAKPVEVPPEQPPPPNRSEDSVAGADREPARRGQNEVPPDTRLKSDRDNVVEKQQVKRGEPSPASRLPR
jgi:hypothetical protein